MFRQLMPPMIPLRVLVALCGALVTLLGLVATADAAPLRPTADGYVRADRPDARYGSAKTLRADGAPRTRMFLRFRVEQGAAPVTRATLRLFTRSTVTASGVQLRKVIARRWTERGLSLRTAPALGSVVARSGTAPAGRWISIDATRLVRAGGVVELGVTATSGTSRAFAAREDRALAPRLVVERAGGAAAAAPAAPATALVAPIPGPSAGTAAVTTTPRGMLGGAQSHGLWSSSPMDVALRELDLLAQAGADVVRYDVAWSSLETSGKGRFASWYVEKIDALFAAAAARGIKVVAALHTTPCWASSAPEELKQGCAGEWWNRDVQKHPPVAASDYADAAAWVAQRWGRYLAALEIWNEPNEADQNFLVSPDPAADYARLVRAAYAPVKAAAPAVPVIVGSTSFADRTFIERLYALGIGGHHDGISIHPYNERRDPDDARTPGLEKWTFRSGVPWVRQAMVANGDADKGIWITELGWSTCDPAASSWCVSEAQQAEYTADAFRIARQDGWHYVKAMIAYNARNKGTSAFDREAQFGLLHRDLQPKPGWWAFRDALAAR